MSLALRKMEYLSFDTNLRGVSCEKAVLTKINVISQTHQSLLIRVAKNDVGAMEQCIQEFGGLVWNLVKRRISSHAVAEDLVQEIFTEIWKSAPRFNSAEGTETTFVAMIARRRVIDWTRKQARSPDLVGLPDNLDELTPSVEMPSIATPDHEEIAALVKTLPDQTRRVFQLHFERGLTQQEIADYTEIPLGSVKALLRRGLLEIRSLLLRNSNNHSSHLDIL
jgi:RNA polymerase sigma-70 factor, ECF subfamily